MAFTTYAEAAIRLRRYISDIPQLNYLDGEFETTDDELVMYVQDTLNQINMDFDPQTLWALSDIVVEPGEPGKLSWNSVKAGAVLQYLTAKGILSARNMLTYSDAGGVTVTDNDRWGRYINYYNVLLRQYLDSVLVAKRRENISRAYTGLDSPLGYDYYWRQ